MVNLHLKTYKKLIRTVLIGVIFVAVLCLPCALTYASYQVHSPNMVIKIDKEGHISYEGNMFDNSLWYPGKKADGTIRIYNEFKRIKVTDLAVQLQLLKWKDEYNRDFVEDSFLRHMKFSIIKDNLLFPNRYLIKDQNLYRTLFREGDKSYQGYHLNNKEEFIIDKGDFLDLQYILEMDWESGNELQDISSNMDISITVAEK